MTAKILIFIGLCFLSINSFADRMQTFTVKNVGISDNSGTVFVNTIEEIEGSTCNDKRQFKLPLADRISDKLYSVALTALVSGKKLTIYYLADVCEGNGSHVNVVILES